MISKWLIEYVGAAPVPVYAPHNPGWYTTNPWEAQWFETEAEAKSFMEKPYGFFGVPFRTPWKAVEHGFECHCPVYADGESWRMIHEKSCAGYGR